eukprot:352193-Chlamydomonas_euryale.AAC.26
MVRTLRCGPYHASASFSSSPRRLSSWITSRASSNFSIALHTLLVTNSSGTLYFDASSSRMRT